MFTIQKEIWPVRRGSKRVDTRQAPQFVPMNRNQTAKVYFVAERMECRTRKFGHQDGDVTRNGLLVLSVLLFHFLNYRHGRLDPSIQAIAERAHCCVRSVCYGLARLKACKILDWVNRCRPEWTELGFRLVQETNAYYIKLDIVPKGPPVPDDWGAPEKLDDDLHDACLRARDELTHTINNPSGTPAEQARGEELKRLKILALENLKIRLEKSGKA